jgi:hypothetical protein
MVVIKLCHKIFFNKVCLQIYNQECKKIQNQLYVIYAYENCIEITSSLNTDNCSKLNLNE